MKQLTGALKKIQLYLGGASITIFFIAILLQIISRYTKITVVWTGEVATYSFIWSIMMGAGYMVSEDKHFSFEMLLDKLSGKKKEYLNIFIKLNILFFGAAIFYYGAIITKQFWNYRLTSLNFVKMGYMWISLPILGFSIIVYSLEHILQYINNIRGN